MLLASDAITTGLFVLAGVVVGGVVTGLVTYGIERRRERASARVAVRVLEAELALAVASADWRLEQGAWSPWNFDRAHLAWREYGPELARVLSTDEWYAVAVAFFSVDNAELRFSNKPPGTPLDAGERESLEAVAVGLDDGLNTLRRRQGLPDIARG